jgi:hypothetical protein
MEQLKETYPLQGIGVPEYYLGGDFKVHKRKDGTETINVCAQNYLGNVCKNIESVMGIDLKSYETPMATNDHPELDDSGLLNHDDHSKYRMLIGCGQWAIILGHLDVMYAVQTMARFSHAPKQGHIDRMLRVFGYLKAYMKQGITYDEKEHQGPKFECTDVNWEEQYPGAREELPPDIPKPKGKPIQITCYVDADHAGDQATRRSVTGIILYVNNTPIKWYSKRQNTVESSTYGAELVALRIAVEMVIEYCYKIRMMGIPLNGPSQMMCDNRSVVLSSTLPSNTLKKKHNAIAYHKVRESVASKIIKVNHIEGKLNVADILTKPLDGTTFRKHVQTCMTKLNQYTKVT